MRRTSGRFTRRSGARAEGRVQSQKESPGADRGGQRLARAVSKGDERYEGEGEGEGGVGGEEEQGEAAQQQQPEDDFDERGVPVNGQTQRSHRSEPAR